MWCFGLHTYKLVDVSHYRDSSYMPPGDIGLASTKVVYICTCCKKIKKRYYYGAGFLPREYFE